MSLIQIQQHDTLGLWENVKVTHIQTNEEEIIVLGKTFRILVNGKQVYIKGGRAPLGK